jgi:hypothetical protein
MAKPNSIRENFNIKKHIKKQIILTCPHNGRENPLVYHQEMVLDCRRIVMSPLRQKQTASQANLQNI